MLTNQELLNPEILQTVHGLELIAKEILSAYFSGQHRGKLKGGGQEFSQYRSYQWGDDLRQLDWKLYARSDRFYIREAETDSQITVHFIIDLSRSMDHESEGISKLNYSRAIVAALAFLTLGQGDKIRFSALNDEKEIIKPPIEGRNRINEFLYELSMLNSQGKWSAKPESFFAMEERTASKQMLILLSDMYEENNEISEFLRLAKASGHEVILFHLMGENELKFKYPANTEFVDLESGERIQTDTATFKKTYSENMDKGLFSLKDQMLTMGLDYQLVNINRPLSDLLKVFIEARNNL